MDNQMTETATVSPRSHRDTVGYLSRKGLVAMLIAMFIIPVATVLTLWYYLPPVSLYALDATVEVVALETAKEFDRRDPNPKVPEPRLVITNTGDQNWTHMIVEINRRYKVYRTDAVVEPGGTIEFGMDFFQTREGVFFAPGRIPLKHVRIYARLPSRARATYEKEYATE